MILGALYMLWAYERVMFGPITKTVNETIADLSAREIAVMVPLIALMLLMGLYPRPLLSRMEPSVGALLGRVHAAQARLDASPARSCRALAAHAPSRRSDGRTNDAIQPGRVINFAWLPILPLDRGRGGRDGRAAGRRAASTTKTATAWAWLSIAPFVVAFVLTLLHLRRDATRWPSRARSRSMTTRAFFELRDPVRRRDDRR